jgi:hypothetical protein
LKPLKAVVVQSGHISLDLICPDADKIIGGIIKMACLKPIQVHNLNKGEKVRFKKYSNIEVARRDMNRNYKTNNFVSCRKCIGCKLDNAKEWSLRCALEAKYHEDNWFITLTYSEEFLPVNEYGIGTVNYQDLRRFIESLRKIFTRKGIKNIKYFAGSEYGCRFNRPHYHVCFFGLSLDDIEPTTERSNLGHRYFVSKLIDRIWHKGIHKIGRVTYESAGYVARYTLKKASTLEYNKLCIVPEKLYMSKGIGKQYFDDHFEQIYKYDVVNLNTSKGLQRFQPPRYFDRLYEKKDPQHLQEIKNARIVNAKHNLVSRVENSGVGYVNLLRNKQIVLHERIKSLKRNVKNKK